MGFQSGAALRQSPQLGALWENHVVCQWLRRRNWSNPAAKLCTGATRPGEVDLLIETNTRLYGVECNI